jgi:curved DNA-binding protein CbpA
MVEGPFSLTKALNVAEPAFRTPRPIAGADIRSLPLNPREAFLFSRIDGSVTEADLCALTGFDAATVSECLDRLVALGAIEIQGPASPGERVSQPQISGDKARAENPRVSQTHLRSPVRAPEMDEQVDLDDEHKRKVLELQPRLSQLDYYTLLGVAESAEKKDIKRAYYTLAPNYHPDKFYGKKLGSFKGKMEAIFAQLTFAYDTLTNAERRAEYDAYLSTQKQTRSMEELLRGATAPAIEPDPVRPDTAVVASSPAPEQGRDSAPAIQGAAPRSKEMDRARREALARKLGVARNSVPPDETAKSGRFGAAAPAGLGPRGAPSNPRMSAPPVSQASYQAAADELKRRHAAIAGDGRRSQARRYFEAGQAALQSNPAAAANAFRLALSLDPENPEIIAAHRDAARIAAVALADGYLRQGDYESRNGQWIEAARSYVKAAAGMPSDASVMQKAAHALVKSSGDMHQAADFAKKAVALSPKRIDPRVVLIEVYIAAGLPLAAKRELEQARQIAPQDDRIAELTRRLK